MLCLGQKQGNGGAFEEEKGEGLGWWWYKLWKGSIENKDNLQLLYIFFLFYPCHIAGVETT